MRPDATSPFPSPFLGLPEAEWLCANDLAFAIFDSFPVSPGHVLAITRRVVPTYFDCTAAGQAALMELVGEVKRLLDQREPKPNGYNVGFNSGTAAGQTVPHVHVHVIPRYAGDMPDPRGGVRHVIPEKGNYLAENRDGSEFSATTGERAIDLGSGEAVSENSLPSLFSLTTGPDRPLWSRLADRLPGASEIDLLASFVQTSGLDHVGDGLFSAIAAGARIRLLVGDYLGITSPDALTTLLGWMASVTVVLRIATTAMPRYDAIDPAWAISSCCTARTCSARSVATAIVSPSSVMNSTSYPLPSSCTSTTVPISPAARPWSGRSHVSTTSSSSSITWD
jgi:diadenosine tetraphosphate (Ap4A) HIT family hydrolase